MNEESNAQLELARKIIDNTGQSLFLTGKAGTGKTTFLRSLRSTSRKRMIVTAPTGIAAINAGGVTLHSFFQLDFGPFVPGAERSDSSRRRMAFGKDKIKMIRGLDLLVIDEVSMVRADMLDAVDDVLRRFRDRTLPFGGVQLLLIGDLQQLPPVVVEAERKIIEDNYDSPYFFDSHALHQTDYLTVELTKVYRQDDADFIRMLNAVRDNRLDRQTLDMLNSRYIAGFNPADSEGYIRLTTHNRNADALNDRRMDALPGEAHKFEAKIEGNFPESSFPVARELVLKEGAQVMFVKNDKGFERRYFNGMIGTVTSIDPETGVVVTPIDSDMQIDVEPVEWENLKFIVNEETGEIEEKREGVFRQLPLKPAWAITIHKSQGLTFERAVIDAAASFSHGQTYVALSRCRSLEGMVLERPISPSAIITDPTVSKFLSHQSMRDMSDGSINSLVQAYRLNLLGAMFNFRPLFAIVEGIERIVKENFSRIYPAMVNELGVRLEEARKEIVDVGDRFRNQLSRLAGEDTDQSNSAVNRRVKDACVYFRPRLSALSERIEALPSDHDNKKVRQKLAERVQMFEESTAIIFALLDYFESHDFSVEEYLDVKAKAAFAGHNSTNRTQKQSRSVASQFSDDNVNPGLFDELCNWRRAKAAELDVKAFVIAHTKTLLAVANHVPATYEDLAMLPGIGPAVIKKYGDDMLNVVDEYLRSHADDVTKLPLPNQLRKKRHRLK